MPDQTYRDDAADDGDKESLVRADLAAVTLTVGGKKIEYDIWKVELEQFIDTHHIARIIIRERGAATKESVFVDVTQYAEFLGKTFSLKVEAQVADEAQSIALSFNGVVGKVELKNSIDGLNVVTVTGYSPTVLMDGAKKNAFYFDKTATDIIGSIVGNYPITRGKAESSSGAMKYCVQYRETDYDFILRLASNAGLFACYDGQEFQVCKAHSDEAVSFEFPVTLGSFTLGLGTKAYEYNTVVYNYGQKKNYGQDSKSITQQASLSENSRLASDASKELYKDSGFTQQASLIEDAQSLDGVLSVKRAQAMGRMVVARGQSGKPTVVTGHSVKVDDMGRMNGTYWVTRVTHVYQAGEGYYNTFECVPLDIACPQEKSARPAITNMQMAVVVDNNDPDQLGRIKVQFPWIESDETPWIRLMTPHAGKDRGWVSLPEIGDEVLVGYEQGSPDLPIALGALYNTEDTPPADAVGDVNNVKMFITKSGNSIVFKDKEGEEEVHLVTKDGKNKITMKVGGPTVIESEGAISIQAGGDVTISGATIKLDSKGEVEIKAGSNAKIQASANLDAKAGGQLQIQGATVAVKGNVIQLN